MNCHVSARELSLDTVAVDVLGDVGIFTASSFKDALLSLVEKGYRNLIVNLDHLRTIDASCLGVLIAARKKTIRQGGRVAVVCNNPNFKQFFALTGLTRLFKPLTSESEAFGQLVASK